METHSLLIVLTGKTASGKDTIKAKLLQKYPDLKKVITTTSRTPRPNEQDGVDYHFLSREQFLQKVQAGDFAEYVEYGGNLYGTQKKELEQALTGNTLWRIDPSRAGEIRDFIKRAFPAEMADQLIKRVIVIYINAPDSVIKERLLKRNLPSFEVEKRMADDAWIWNKYSNDYDFVIDNVVGKLDETLDKVEQIIENHRS